MKEYSIGLYEKAIPDSLSWEEKLYCAGELGYDFVEISIDESDERLARLEWTSAQRLKINEAMKKTGINIRSMCLSAHRKYPFGASSTEIRNKSLAIMQKAISFADDLGIRYIQLAGYDTYYEKGSYQSRVLFEKNLRKAVELAACQGILLGFETMETDFMNTTSKAMQYVSLINSPYLGVYPDCGNLTNAASANPLTVIEDLTIGKGHIIAMHLKDTVPGKFREIPFTTGHVDFDTIISQAWKLGVRRYVSEMWDTGKADWKEDIKRAIKYLSGILDQQ